MPAQIPLAPTGLFVNIEQEIAYLVWEKVERDINHNYLSPAVVGYFVFRTANPNGTSYGSPIGFVNTLDEYSLVDVFFIDFAGNANYIYQICPTMDGVTITGDCIEGIGIVGPSQPTIPLLPPISQTLIWDVGIFDINLWG